LRSTDMAIEAIAAQVGLSEPTLRKYYLRELEKGPDLARGRVIEAMYAKAIGGNVTAQRAYLQLTEKGQGIPPPARTRKPAEPKPEALGKKAAAELEAITAHEGTGWGEILKH
jgi:hypothetical protein